MRTPRVCPAVALALCACGATTTQTAIDPPLEPAETAPSGSCPAGPGDAVDPRLAEATAEDQTAARSLSVGQADSATAEGVRAALAEATAGSTAHPRHAFLHYARGSLLSTLERKQEALAAYEQAIRIEPRFAGAIYNAGVVLHGLGRVPDALEHFDRATALDPLNVDAWYNAGQVHYGARRYEQALRTWRCAYALEPNVGTGGKIVQSLHALGRFVDALGVRARLRAAWSTSADPETRARREYVIDQFSVGNLWVYVSEILESVPDELEYIYRFDVTVADHVQWTVQLETSPVLREQGVDSLIGIDDGEGHSQAGITFRSRPTYEELRTIAMDVIRRHAAASAATDASRHARSRIVEHRR